MKNAKDNNHNLYKKEVKFSYMIFLLEFKRGKYYGTAFVIQGFFLWKKNIYLDPEQIVTEIVASRNTKRINR